MVDVTEAWQAVYQGGPREAAAAEKLATAKRNTYARAMEREMQRTAAGGRSFTHHVFGHAEERRVATRRRVCGRGPHLGFRSLLFPHDIPRRHGLHAHGRHRVLGEQVDGKDVAQCSG